MHCAKITQKNVGAAQLTSDKVDFRAKNINQDKEVYSIMIHNSSRQHNNSLNRLQTT